MNKKLIALILVLPMALMMTLYTAVKSVSLKVDIPVSKVEYLGEEFVTLDLDKNQRYFVDYAVYPTSASNKKVNFSFEKVGSMPFAELEERDGYIYPKSAGYANVCITTAEGAHKDKFQIAVKAEKLKQINCTLEKSVLIIGETAKIQTEFIPHTATDKLLTYESSNSAVASVNDLGEVKAIGKGETQIIVRSLSDENVYDVISVIVSVEDVLTVDQKVTTLNNSASIRITIDTLEEYDVEKDLKFSVLDLDGNSLENVINPSPLAKVDDNGNFKFEFEFISDNFYGTLKINFTITTATRTLTKTCLVERLKVEDGFNAEFIKDDPIYVTVGSSFMWTDYISVTPEEAKQEISYSVDYDNGNVVSVLSSNYARANKLGSTRAGIEVTYKETTIYLEKSIYVCPSDLTIKESLTTYGIENIWTIGGTDAQGKKTEHKLTLNYGGGEKGENFGDIENLISFTSSSEKVSVSNDGIIEIEENFNDVVEIYATLKANGETVSPSLKIRCVEKGVDVYNFKDLYDAVKAENVVVLQNNVIEDFGTYNGDANFYKNNLEKNKIESTYDTTYYKNIGSTNTKIITLLQFKADVYGNGFEINADKVTKDNSLTRLFNGPLHFVSLADSGASGASVKAQDNVCFAVFENTTLNNVVLKGCKDVDNLTHLNLVGTVVEVFGDNVNVEYCRISNGRTVLRAFGDVSDSSKVINLNLKNSILGYAREFVLRLGSNCFVSPTSNVVNGYSAPYIDPNDVFDFPAIEFYNHEDRTPSEKQDYLKKYIKTYVNVENCVLERSGIFCVGLDSHFSGPLLLDAEQVEKIGSIFQGLGWKDLAKTSYGVKLTFNGDVRIYDWKNVNSVDSSTLIEGELSESLKLDIKEMIGRLEDKSMVYLDEETGDQYVHGGIVFFGGGRNYSVFEDQGESFKGHLDGAENVKFSNYKISLKEVDKELLEAAAGDCPFYFMLYSGNSRFNPLAQAEIFSSGSAYDCIHFND